MLPLVPQAELLGRTRRRHAPPRNTMKPSASLSAASRTTAPSQAARRCLSSKVSTVVFSLGHRACFMTDTASIEVPVPEIQSLSVTSADRPDLAVSCSPSRTGRNCGRTSELSQWSRTRLKCLRMVTVSATPPAPARMQDQSKPAGAWMTARTPPAGRPHAHTPPSAEFYRGSEAAAVRSGSLMAACTH